ncbi:Lnb N-terminal periplasmic domain-containing protein [Pseudogemmobacter humi]|uniref:Lnb N-terminal periplasmic domain-containing protein n=1 Tax=Pseudogemmobacter humi TaxID=2483812 RepID=UPI003F49B232
MLFWLLLPLFLAWAATALWVQFPGARAPALGALVVAVAVVVWLRLGPGWGWTGLAVLVLCLSGWYFSLVPRQDRDWAPDVSRIVRGEVAGDIVTLENVRAFRWIDADTADEAWTSRRVDLTKIEGADMITSVWGNPLIAHLLVSFRFTDAPPVTFSVEIRREKGEKFSALGGFFRQFELALIAADEDDIVQWRAVPRAEEVRLYPLTLTPDQARQVFLQYVDLGNDLNRKPRWYNTLTSNCTTVVWQLSKVLSPDLPLDPSLLLSGRLPEYLDKFGALAGEGTLAEKRGRALISARARAMPPGEDFAAWIRP